MTAEKISDSEVIRLYREGFNDTEIAKIKNMSHGEVWYRRCKLGLVSRGRNSKKLSSSELQKKVADRTRKQIKNSSIYNKIARLLKRKHNDLYIELIKEVVEKEKRDKHNL